MVRKMMMEDKTAFINMTDEFYSSDAVLHPIPQNYHIETFDEIMRSNTYLEAYIFEFDDEPAGYAIVAKSYSHEAGGIVLWIDELYVSPAHRSKGLGKDFISSLKATDDSSVARIRLEVESDNERAVNLYRKMGFSELKYAQMFVDIKN